MTLSDEQKELMQRLTGTVSALNEVLGLLHANGIGGNLIEHNGYWMHNMTAIIRKGDYQ